MERIIRPGFQLVFGIKIDIRNWDDKDGKVILSLKRNPLMQFVSLPVQIESLQYSVMFCGVIRGALGQLAISVSCKCSKDNNSESESLIQVIVET